MLSFNEQEFLNGEKAALALRGQVEHAIDEICAKGFKNIVLLGIGGTYAHGLQMQNIVDTYSDIPFYVVNAGEFLHQGFKKLTDDSLVIIESASGDTQEVVDAVKIVKRTTGATIYGIINKPGTILCELSDYVISLPVGVHYKLFFTFMRLLHNLGDFPRYDAFCESLERLPEALVAVRKQFDPVAEQIARDYGDRPLYHLVGAGCLWGFVYSYGMCTLEEMLWMKTKSVHGAEFFHGALEVVDRDSTLFLFLSEDSSRPVMERVARFAPKICANVLTFDTKDFALEGVAPEFRGLVAPFVMMSVCDRLNVHFEWERRHPLDIRRYYRRLDY